MTLQAMVPLWTGGAGRLVSLATQGCWGPKFLSSPPAVRSVLELLTCPPPPPATCTGGQGDQRVVKSKPECHGVCRKQPGPEQGPGGGGDLHHPSCALTPTWLLVAEILEARAWVWAHTLTVCGSPQASAQAPLAGEARGRHPAPCCPGPPHAGRASEARRPSPLSWWWGRAPGHGPEGPHLRWGSG